MTELDMFRLREAGIPVHVHNAAKRGKWICSSPYCDRLTAETARAGPQEPPEYAKEYDHGDLDA